MRPQTAALALSLTVALSLVGACDKKEEAPAEVTRTETVQLEVKKTEAPAPEATTTAEAADPGLIIVDSDQPVAATVERLRGDIEAKGMKIMAVVDHSANAAGVGLELPPTQLILFGKPEGGTLLMQAKRTVAIDLPQKMLVWEEDGRTKIAFNDPTWMLARHGAEVPAEMPTKIRAILDGLAKGGAAAPAADKPAE
ncbi:MAG: DUF302 domain-containing protein [Myxococcales bacterium]|nr:DUF302 domain-containing protein [Myxococcales bacterium]